MVCSTSSPPPPPAPRLSPHPFAPPPTPSPTFVLVHALALWHQFTPDVRPVVDTSGQPVSLGKVNGRPKAGPTPEEQELQKPADAFHKYRLQVRGAGGGWEAGQVAVAAGAARPWKSAAA